MNIYEIIVHVLVGWIWVANWREKKKSFLVAFQAVLACRANSAEMVQITVLRYYDFKNTQRREMQ